MYYNTSGVLVTKNQIRETGIKRGHIKTSNLTLASTAASKGWKINSRGNNFNGLHLLSYTAVKAQFTNK